MSEPETDLRAAVARALFNHDQRGIAATTQHREAVWLMHRESYLRRADAVMLVVEQAIAAEHGECSDLLDAASDEIERLRGSGEAVGAARRGRHFLHPIDESPYPGCPGCVSGEDREAAHPVYQHRDGSKCIWLDGDGWFVPLDAGGEGYACEHPEHDAQMKTLLARHAPHENELKTRVESVLYSTQFRGQFWYDIRSALAQHPAGGT